MSMYAGISEIGLRSRIEVPVAKAFVGSSPTSRTKYPIPELFSRVMSTTQLLTTPFFWNMGFGDSNREKQNQLSSRTLGN